MCAYYPNGPYMPYLPYYYPYQPPTQMDRRCIYKASVTKDNEPSVGG